MIRRPPRSTLSSSSAASDVYKRQAWNHAFHTAAQPRVGAGDFVYGLDPNVSGDRIRWTVPKECVQASTEEVLKRVAAANKRFREVLDERAAHQARKQRR